MSRVLDASYEQWLGHSDLIVQRKFIEELNGVLKDAHNLGVPSGWFAIPPSKGSRPHATGRLARIGNGRNHIALGVGVHANEPLGRLTALQWAKLFMQNPHWLKELDISLDIVLIDEQGAEINDLWIAKEGRTIDDYVYSHYRDAYSNDEEWGQNYKDKIIRSYMETLASSGHDLAVWIPLHNITIWDGAFAGIRGRDDSFEQRIAARVETTPRLAGIPICAGGIYEHVAGPKIAGTQSVRQLRDEFPLGNGNVAQSSTGLARSLFKNPTTASLEIPLWVPSIQLPEFEGLTPDQVKSRRQQVIGELVANATDFFPIALEAVPKSRMAVSAFSVVANNFLGFQPTEVAFEVDVNGHVSSRVARHAIGIEPFYVACRAVHVVNLLESLTTFAGVKRGNPNFVGTQCIPFAEIIRALGENDRKGPESRSSRPLFDLVAKRPMWRDVSNDFTVAHQELCAQIDSVLGEVRSLTAPRWVGAARGAWAQTNMGISIVEGAFNLQPGLMTSALTVGVGLDSEAMSELTKSGPALGASENS